MNSNGILAEIRAPSLLELTAQFRISIPSQRHLTDEFFDALSEKDQFIVRIIVEVEARRIRRVKASFCCVEEVHDASC
jgi:hypothetical protein